MLPTGGDCPAGRDLPASCRLPLARLPPTAHQEEGRKATCRERPGTPRPSAPENAAPPGMGSGQWGQLGAGVMEGKPPTLLGLPFSMCRAGTHLV